MQNDTPIQNRAAVMDRAEVEKIAYQAIGHQFRLPSLFSMLLLVVGFVMGHYVAAKHTGEIADRFEQRITTLTEKVSALELGTVGHALPARLTLEAAQPLSLAHNADTRIHDAPLSYDHAGSQEAPTFRLAGMGRTFESPATDFTMMSHAMLGDVDPNASGSVTRTALETMKKTAEGERDACLAELAPYVERRLSVPSATVVEVIQKIYVDLNSGLDEAMNDADSKANGIHSRDTSVKIFPPMSEDDAAGEPAAAEAKEPGHVGYRFFPKPSAARSLFFSPVTNRVPAPATSAIETDTIVR